MKLIGLNGFKKSGKDTTYRILAESLDAKVVRRAFADKLKIAAAYALGFDRPHDELIALMDECKDRWVLSVSRNHAPLGENWMLQAVYMQRFHELTGREYLQHFGNRMREVFGTSFWVDQVLPSDDVIAAECETVNYDEWQRDEVVAERFDNADYGVITDARYPNEAERILDLGGEIWEIVRPGVTSDGHASEQPLPQELVTRTIHNDSDLDTLKQKVLAAAAEGDE